MRQSNNKKKKHKIWFLFCAKSIFAKSVEGDTEKKNKKNTSAHKEECSLRNEALAASSK